MLIFAVHESLPAFARVAAENVGKPRVQLDLVLVQVLVQLLRAQHLRDSNQLKIKENNLK